MENFTTIFFFNNMEVRKKKSYSHARIKVEIILKQDNSKEQLQNYFHILVSFFVQIYKVTTTSKLYKKEIGPYGFVANKKKIVFYESQFVCIRVCVKTNLENRNILVKY